jgi:Ion transport protein
MILVSISVLDVTVSYSVQDIGGGKGAISAFRAFRLIRVFKLAKSWTQLQKLIATITKSLVDISSFSVLLFLLMFIYILLGMELFSQSNIPVNQKSRHSFNSFFESFLVIFQVLTGENWDEVMFTFAQRQGYAAIMFFISLIIIGVMIFLNLFLAILLKNFEVTDEDIADPNSSMIGSNIIGFKQRLTNLWGRIKRIFTKRITEKIEIENLENKRDLVNESNGQLIKELNSE